MVKIVDKKDKEKEIKEVEKVHVSIYADEFETVKDEMDIDEVTSRKIREAMGLPLTHSKTGAKSKLIAQIREMSKEEAEEKLKETEEDE